MVKSALFVCLGNICRSPIAEAVFLHVLGERGERDQWRVDSAALGDWHAGNPPDRRARATMKRHGIHMDSRARLVTQKDFADYEYIFGMDESNIEELKELAPSSSRAKIELLGKYDPEGELIIRDPYYDSGDAGFEKCYQQCLRCCTGFLDSLR